MKGFSLFISMLVHLGGGLLISLELVQPAEFMSALPAPSLAVSLVASQVSVQTESPVTQSSPPAPLPEPPKSQELPLIPPVEKKPAPKKFAKPKQDVPVAVAPAPVSPASSPSPSTVESRGDASDSVLVRAHPDYLRNPPPVYPEECRRRGEEGLVVLSVAIAADGSPSDVQIKDSSKCERLDQAAFKAVSKWKFKPATLAGLPISSRVDVPIRFSLREK